MSLQLPFRCRRGTRTTTVYDQLALIGIDLNAPLGESADAHARQLTQVAARSGSPPNPYYGAQRTGVDQDYKNPRATQVGAGFEREFVPGSAAGRTYIYVKTDHLQRNVN